jgi:3-phenylpropionate/cinnamic acid dioxygenase small subunit
MSDEQEIRNLAYLYAELNDTGDWAGIGRLLSRGKLIRYRANVPSAVSEGDRDIEKFYETHVQIHDGSPGTRHVITNLIVTIAEDGMSASTRSYFVVLQCLPDFPLQMIASGRYFDRFAKDEAGWHFAEKTIRVDYSCDLSRHAKPL